MVRDSKGRYVKGHPGTGGRRPRQKEERYLEILIDNVTVEDWRAIIDKAKEQAKRGDSVARKFLADYLIGPPIERKEVENSGAVVIKVVYDGK